MQRQDLPAVIIVAVILVVVVLLLFFNGGIRRIAVQYSKKSTGKKNVWRSVNTSIPLKVNTAGVIPIIFSSSLMSFPILIASSLERKGTGIGSKILKGLKLPVTGLIRVNRFILLVLSFTFYLLYSLHISIHLLLSILWRWQII